MTEKKAKKMRTVYQLYTQVGVCCFCMSSDIAASQLGLKSYC